MKIVADYITQPQAFSRLDRSFLGDWWWTIDRAMLASILFLAILGVALVATASPAVSQTIGVGDYHFLKKHIIFLIPSVFLVVGLSMLPARYVWRVSSLILLGALIAMVAVLFVGAEVKGAKRWLYIVGFSIQPAEFIKPAFIVVAAWLIALQKTSLRRGIAYKAEGKGGKNFLGYYISAAIYFLLLTLLLMQPDMGMSFVLTCVFAAQIFLAGLRFRYMAILFSLGAIGAVMSYFFFYHVKSRVDRFWNPATGDNYQVEKSLEAIRAGGFLGVGPGQGVEKMNLPDAHADFIFSVLAEEMGAVFVLILVGVFLFILLRGFKRLQEKQDIFSILAAGGLLTMFGLQAFIHMGSAVRLLPAKGMTLPFISYGGSSMLSMAIAMGMLLALTRRTGRSSITGGSVVHGSIKKWKKSGIKIT